MEIKNRERRRRSSNSRRTPPEWAYTLCISPNIIKVASIDEPPQERSGRVMPMTGSIAKHMPTLSRICTTSIPPMPTQMRPP